MNETHIKAALPYVGAVALIVASFLSALLWSSGVQPTVWFALASFASGFCGIFVAVVAVVSHIDM